MIRVKNHRIQPGDTLESIAKLHGTTAKHLVEINGFRTKTLEDARTLIMVPSKEDTNE